MQTNVSRISEANVTLSPSKHHARFNEHTDLFYKKLDAIKEIIQCRGDIFSQKKEKYQHFVDFQTKKVEKEKEECLKKTDELSRKIEESLTELATLDQKYSEIKLKNSNKEVQNEALREKISNLQLEIKEKDEQFNSTSKNYLTVIGWYEKFLNMTVDLDKENCRIVRILFISKKCFDENPHVEIQLLDDQKYKVLKVHSLLGEESFAGRTLEKPELMLFLYKIHNRLISSE